MQQRIVAQEKLLSRILPQSELVIERYGNFEWTAFRYNGINQ